MQTTANKNKKWTTINSIILFFLSTPAFISIALLYVLWFTARYDAKLFLKPPGYGSVWGDPKYHVYYEPLSPYINSFWRVAVLFLPVILIYYIVLLIRKKPISKILFFAILLFYLFIIGNMIFVRLGRPWNSNPFSALNWYID